MSIKLNGATSGSVELDVPDAIGSDLSVTIPATAGDIVVKGTDGSVDLGDVNIDSSGRLLVGTSSTSAGQLLTVQGSIGDATGIAKISRSDAAPAATGGLGILDFSDSGHVTAARIRAVRDGGTWTSGSSQPSALTFSTTANGASSPTERMRLAANGRLYVQGAYDNASGAATANLQVSSNGEFIRASSSIKYKTNIETIDYSYSELLLNCRPVWYRSNVDFDNPNHSWWGFIAEEVAEIDPRLVHWKTVNISYDENGSAVETPCDPEPEGVAYERFVPHLLNLIKRQGEAIADLQAEVAALKGA